MTQFRLSFVFAALVVASLAAVASGARTNRATGAALCGSPSQEIGDASLIRVVIPTFAKKVVVPG